MCETHRLQRTVSTADLMKITNVLWVAAQVEVTHLGKKKRKYRVKGLEQAANRLMFRNEQENRDMSVAEYFEATYHIKCGRHCQRCPRPACRIGRVVRAAGCSACIPARLQGDGPAAHAGNCQVSPGWRAVEASFAACDRRHPANDGIFMDADRLVGQRPLV